MMDTPKEERSLVDLLANLALESSTLIRKEGELARAELTQKLSQVQQGLLAVALGTAVMVAGLFYLLDAVVYGVAELLPPELSPWLAALLVGAVVGTTGLVMLQKGRQALKPANMAPERTARSLREDRKLIEEQLP